jgi:Raf kinase inhibitor-like YbhB/YbcL family protein
MPCPYRREAMNLRIWNASAFFLATIIFLLLLPTNTIYGGGLMEISSSAFKDKGKIPVQYVMPGAGGNNLSIPLTWKNAPPGTKSFALSVIDPHPVAQNWVHWLVINIPPQATSLEEGASVRRMPAGSQELINSFGEIGYGGPQPPKGTGEHPYVITLYALNVEKLELGVNTSLGAFKKMIEGKIIQSASLTGKYER